MLWVQEKVYDGEVHMVQVPIALNAEDIETKTSKTSFACVSLVVCLR